MSSCSYVMSPYVMSPYLMSSFEGPHEGQNRKDPL